MRVIDLGIIFFFRGGVFCRKKIQGFILELLSEKRYLMYEVNKLRFFENKKGRKRGSFM